MTGTQTEKARPSVLRTVDKLTQIWNNLNSWLSSLNLFQRVVIEKSESIKLALLAPVKKSVSMKKLALWKFVQTMSLKVLEKEESGT